ncbi:MAG: hypothetical protein ACRD1E_00035, partial [Terriglobales bacterium]
AWDIPGLQRHYFEALRWALGDLPGEAAPHPARAAAAAPVPLPGLAPPCGPAWALELARRARP